MDECKAMDSLQGVSIVVVNRNGAKSLENNLPHVLELSKELHGPSEVLLVDDGKDEDSRALLTGKFANLVKLVPQGEEVGFGPSCWSGVQEARHGLVLLLRAEARPLPGLLAPLLRYFGREDTFAVSPLFLTPEGEIIDGSFRIPYFKHGRVHYWQWDWDEVVPRLPWPIITLWNCGATVLFHREKFLQLGGFCSLSPPFSREDAELGVRAWRHGWRCYTEPGAVVVLSSDSPALSPFEEEKSRREEMDGGPLPLNEVIDSFSEYYGEQLPPAFQAVIVLPSRRRKKNKVDYDGAIELAAAKKLREAFSNARVVDLGCGKRKFPGAIGVDVFSNDSVDVIHNLDEYPWPIEDGFCDLVIASHIVEHVRDFGGFLRECYRILRPFGTAVIRCPHFSNRESFRNPTHVRHLTYDSIKEMLYEGMSERNDLSCSQVPFTLTRTLLSFRGRSRAKLGRYLANRHPRLWEQNWSSLLSARENCWVLRKFKPPQFRISKSLPR